MLVFKATECLLSGYVSCDVKTDVRHQSFNINTKEHGRIIAMLEDGRLKIKLPKHHGTSKIVELSTLDELYVWLCEYVPDYK